MNKPNWIAAKENEYEHNLLKCSDITTCFKCTSLYGKQEAWNRYLKKQMKQMGWKWNNKLHDWVLPRSNDLFEYEKKKALYYSLLTAHQHCTDPDCKIENCATYY